MNNFNKTEVAINPYFRVCYASVEFLRFPLIILFTIMQSYHNTLFYVADDPKTGEGWKWTGRRSGCRACAEIILLTTRDHFVNRQWLHYEGPGIYL